MAADGNNPSTQVGQFGYEKKHAKVVDSILDSAVYMSRLMGTAKKMEGKYQEFILDIDKTNQGQFFVGLENLNLADVDTTITLQYAQTGYTIPFVVALDDAIANAGAQQVIDLPVFKMEKVAAEGYRDVAEAAYGTGSGNQPNGLGKLIDSSGTIGGQSRSTYSALQSYELDTSGTLTLTKMATADDEASASGYATETPNVVLMDKTVWSLAEELLQPYLEGNYTVSGYPRLGVRGDTVQPSAQALGGQAGFVSMIWRGKPLIKDDAATSQTMFFINENYLGAYGRTEVPTGFENMVKYITLPKAKTLEGAAAQPSQSHGWFVQEYMPTPGQAGMFGRYYWFGQICTSQPRRHAKLTGITGV